MTCLAVVAVGTLVPSAALTQPVIESVASSGIHGEASSISGSGFGTKPGSSPAVWDDCDSEGLSSQWDGAWPSASGSDNLKCRSPIRGIGLPHNNISMYLAGSHAGNDGYNAGWNVIAYKNRTISSYPAYTYASWYQRSDDSWTFCDDNNYKVFDFSMGNSPYTMPENWYIEYNGRPTSRTSTPSWHLNDDGSSLQNSDSWWWGSAVNPMSGVWTKIEVEIRYSPNSDGYIRLWENGRQRIDYQGATDRYPGQSRSEGIGGYGRCSGFANNWRYFADVYIDHTRARVVLADNADYTQARIVEPQPIRSWADQSIAFTLNLGKLDPRSAYVFVVDRNGRRNATGIPFDSSAVIRPNPPTDLVAE